MRVLLVPMVHPMQNGNYERRLWVWIGGWLRTSTVKEDDYGLVSVVGVLGPYVEIETILASILVTGSAEIGNDRAELFGCAWVGFGG